VQFRRMDFNHAAGANRDDLLDGRQHGTSIPRGGSKESPAASRPRRSGAPRYALMHLRPDDTR
jgi:hypothetical protein